MFHCPRTDCKGVIDSKELKFFQLKVACTICKDNICARCRLVWHEGVKCSLIDDKEFTWEGMGDGKAGTANRCPKCKSPFEKVDGCMHMKCAMCEYEWCWVCGLAYNSIFHYGQAGGLMCELIGQTSFNPKRGTCCRVLGLVGLFILLPVILLGFCAIGGVGGSFILI